MRQGPPQRSPEGALGRKRAGPWEGTELDLDDYRSSKRGRGQEIACDLRHMHLEGGLGASQQRDGGGPAADQPPTMSTGSLPTSMVCSEGAISPQAMQYTPRSEARTPSVQRQGGGAAAAAGGGQPSVHSGKHRLGASRCTPVRLLDALPPTSPSDPAGLDGVDLRKATLMRSLQSRLLKGEGEGTGPSPPGAVSVLMPAGAAVAAAAAAGEQQAQQAQEQLAQQAQHGQPQQDVQQGSKQQQQQQQQAAPPFQAEACSRVPGPPPTQSIAAAGFGGRAASASPAAPSAATSSVCSMMEG